MSDILNQFRDEELPVSTVDIAGAVRAGRRRRVRTWATTVGVTVAVVAAGATAPLWLNRATPPPVTPACDTQFDPLTYEIDTSGVAGYQLTATTSSTYWQLAGLHDPVNDRDVQVILFACGGQPYLLDGTGPVDPATGESADQAVNGQPAYWLPPNDARTPLGLAWQWRPGAWAIVSTGTWQPKLPPGSGGPGDLRAAARQVAAQLRFGAGTAVTAPVALPAPEGTYPAVIFSQFAYDNGRRTPISYAIDFDPLGTDPPTHDSGYTPYLEIRATPFAAVDDLPQSATPYPEDLGYPAYSVVREDLDDLKILLVLDFFTFSLEILPWQVPGTPEEKLAVAADVFRSITAYPDSATDLSAWGTPLA